MRTSPDDLVVPRVTKSLADSEQIGQEKFELKLKMNVLSY